MKLFKSKTSAPVEPTTETEPETTEPTEDTVVSAWSPEEGEQALLVADQDEATAFYLTVVETAANNPEQIEWFGFDLQNTMFGGKSEAHASRLALNLHEAWDLSLALEQEVIERQQGKEGKLIIVLIERGDFLADVLADEENREDLLFSSILPNLNKVVSEGADVNIYVLMRVQPENVEEWRTAAFTQTVKL